MPKKSIPQLKDKFQKGDKPMQEDFYDLLDSFIHRDEDISKILIKIASISEAENGSDNVKHMTPLLTKKAIYALTRLADIPDLATEVQQKIDASINSLLTLEDADNLINTVKDVLDFVQGAGEDLNIITELNKARTNAVSDVRGGVGGSWDTLKKMYDWAISYFSKKNGEYVNFSAKGLMANTIITPRNDDSNSRRFSCYVIEGHINKGSYGGWDYYINKKLVILKVDGDVVIRLTAGGANADNIFVPNINDYIPNGSLVHVYLESECNIISPSYSNIATVSDLNGAIANAANDATSKANAAHSTALIDVRNGVATELNTLKKLYDWAISLLNTKVDKSALSSNISSTSTINAATSKAVNDSKQNAIATAASDATSKANSAHSSAVDDVRGGVQNQQNTLKKMYDWIISVFDTKANKNGDYCNFHTKALVANTLIIPKIESGDVRRTNCLIIQGHVNKGEYGGWAGYVGRTVYVVDPMGDKIFRLLAGGANADNMFIPNINDHFPNGSRINIYLESGCNIVSPDYSQMEVTDLIIK